MSASIVTVLIRKHDSLCYLGRHKCSMHRHPVRGYSEVHEASAQHYCAVDMRLVLYVCVKVSTLLRLWSWKAVPHAARPLQVLAV